MKTTSASGEQAGQLANGIQQQHDWDRAAGGRAQARAARERDPGRRQFAGHRVEQLRLARRDQQEVGMPAATC